MSVRTNLPCIETMAEGRKVHAWRSTGLDIVDDVLCSTRECVWCQTRQHKPYGAGSAKAWRVSAHGHTGGNESI